MRRLVVEADGGSRGNPGPAAYGALVRDATTGQVLAETADYIGKASNNVAEYRGVIAGLGAARDLDPDAAVEARLDSRLVVEQMAGRWQIKHPGLRPLAQEARQVFPAGRVRYTWVPRRDNVDADRLVNEVLDARAAGQQWRRPAGGGGGKSDGWAPDLGAPTTLVLLRHGETPLSIERRFSGVRTDPELTAKGRDQARAAAGRISSRYAVEAGSAVDAVIASPLRRSMQTARIVARALGRGREVEVDEGWREADFGAWEGHSFAEIRQRWPDDLAAWLGSTAVPPQGGESFDEVAERVAAARDKVVARHPGQTVLVVSHVTPIKTVVRLALDASPQALYRMELDLASLTVVAWFPDGRSSLRLFNG
ncbi:MAG: bifunctional RNase H/acid phosphatase [Carbonactinosporaceae bacterium]